MFSKKIISIDIGTKNTKIVVGKQNKQQVFIEDAIMFPTPKDSFHDGRISDPGKLKESILNNIKKNKIKASFGICTVESSSIITRELILPSVKKQEMDQMVSYEIEQYLPIMLSEYVVEYKILEEIIEDNIKKLRILVAALPKLIAEGYLNLLNELKLKPLALDMNSNAISKLFTKGIRINNEKYTLDKTTAVVDIGYSNMNISIISKGIPQFNRIIPIGGRDVDMNLANTFNLTLDMAETKKINDGNLEQDTESTSTTIMLNEMISSSIDSWIIEIQKIFQYYNSRVSGNRIDEIYIYGGGSKLKGLDMYLSNSFNIPSLKIDTVNFIKPSKKSGISTLEDYLNVASAIIRR